MGTESTAAIRTNAEVSPVIQTQFAATLRDLTCASAKLVSMVTVSRALIKMSVYGQGTYVIRQLRVQIFLDHECSCNSGYQGDGRHCKGK